MAIESDQEWLVQISGLSKAFGGVAALKNAEFRLRAGSVHALCGGNGAGKSTFLSILMGIIARDAGSVRLRGSEISFAEPADALHAGIAIIEQELSPVMGMSIAENIFLGREFVTPLGFIDHAKMNRKAQTLLDELGFNLSAKTQVSRLTVAQIQLVEIAKALSHDADIIIMDEPTSALGEAEAAQLFQVVRRLKERGKSIIYVSHRLSEIFDIADSYTVFRDGQFVADGALSSINRAELIRLIVGHDISEEFAKSNTPKANVMMQVSGLTRPGKLADINMSLHQGEILGIYGLMGSGRTEFLECLFGLDKRWTGQVQIDGTDVRIQSVQDALKHRLALVTEDRKNSGLNMIASVRDNLSQTILPQLSPKMGMMAPRKQTRVVAEAIKRFHIKTASDQLGVSSLSGGNQQKVVMAKWDLTNPRILLLDEPTRGVDVGAKREIYALMSEFAQAGGAIIMVSSEVEEVLGMSDRVVVFHDGKITGELDRAEADQKSLLHLAA